MLDKSFWQGMDGNASLRLASIVQERASISTISSDGQRVVRTSLTTSYRYAPRVTDGFTNIPPRREKKVGLLPVMVQ